MFRMEFQAMDAVEEDDGPLRGCGTTKVWEARTFQGHVGGGSRRQRRTVDALPDGSHLAPVLTRSAPSWVEVDLIDFDAEPAAAVDQEVLSELVKPFAESVNLTHQPSGKRIDSDVFVTFLEFQPDQRSCSRRDLLSDGTDFGSFRNAESLQTRSGSFRNVDSLQTRSSSMRSNGSDSSDAEGSPFYADRAHINNEDKGSPAARAYNRAFNKLMHKKSKPTVSDAKMSKPWEEPLLASHEQMKLQRKLEKEAKLEAKREAESRKRELLKLANPVPESAMKEQYKQRKGIHKLFQLSSGSPKEGGAVDARESKLVMPKASMFESCVSPSATEVTLSHIRSGPRPSMRKDLHFATVESNQRNVEAWTMEEYMAKNARLPEWTARGNDEEFGGIEGQLLNQHLDDDVIDRLDSDSD